MKEAVIAVTLVFVIVFVALGIAVSLGGCDPKVRVEEDGFSCERFHLPEGYHRTSGRLEMTNNTATVTIVFEKETK